MKDTMRKGTQCILTSLFFILSLCLLASITEIRLDSLQKLGRCAFSEGFRSQNAQEKYSSSDEIRILIGVLTVPDQYKIRHLLRLVYGTQSPVGAKVDVKFVFCNLTNEEQEVLIGLEIMRHDDIIILNCEENVNNGKTYNYFSILSEMLNEENRTYPPYHYVAKADAETYFRLETLVGSLRALPREDLYYGVVESCSSNDPLGDHMVGPGYLVSWDIVEWIRSSDIPKSHMNGSEDQVFAGWLRDGNRGKNRFSANEKWLMYNYPEGENSKCAHEFWPGTAGVLRLWTQEKWITTLTYFNATKDLKPSKLYHIDPLS